MDPFEVLPITSPETLISCKYLDVTEKKTIFIASYPKSGTTWLQCIVYQLLSRGDETFSHISDFSPFYESNKTWNNTEFVQLYSDNHNKLGARIFNTHLRWNMLPHGENVYTIYVYRNGKDVVHSFFQHLSNQADSGTYEGTFEQFYLDWLEGKIPYGTWAKHLQTWIDSAKDSSNQILLLRYEDLKHNLLDCLLQISQHVGTSYSREELEELILPHCTFDYMKTHKHQYEPVSVPWKQGFEFIRKGQIGDSASVFTDRMNILFDEMIQKEFPNGIPDWLVDYIRE